jgi:hypothetical protein
MIAVSIQVMIDDRQTLTATLCLHFLEKGVLPAFFL